MELKNRLKQKEIELLNKVGIKINGAKVKETYNRNIGRYKPKHKDANVNTNITQYLHSPKIYG